MHILSNISSLRTYTLSVLLLSTLFLTACDSGGSSLTEKQIALNKISAYAEDGSKSVPSLQDYIDAGVGGLNGGSLADFNALVEKLGKEDVDTTAEIEALVETPIAMPVSAITDEDTPKDITLVGLEFDGDALTYSKVTGPAHGSLSIAGNIATYTPTANYNGSDSFTYKANDGTGDSNTATVSITVNAVNDAPTANAGNDANVIEGETLALTGVGADVDTGDTLTYSWSPATNLSATNIANPNFTAPTISENATQVYTLTVTDSATPALTATDTVTITSLNLPAQPQNVQVTAGNAQVTLSWDSVADATGYDICLATETINTPANCAVLQNGALHVDQTSLATITGLTNNTRYYFVIIPKNTHGSGVVSDEATALTSAPAQASPTGALNDTGITLCGDYPYDAGGSLIAGHSHSNSENCTNTVDGEDDPIPAGQDGHSGRDVTHNDNSDGNAGFNFTKLNANGVTLADQSVAYADTPWNCVKDNVTGLIWEIKTISGLHNTNDSYTWYNPDALTNGGSAGYQRRSDQTGVESDNPTCLNYANGTESTYCNTKAYVARVNAEAYCGATDWRMPSREELHSIVDYSRQNPAIDVDYFPSTLSWPVWSSSPYAYGSSYAWDVHFSNGYDSSSFKNYHKRVRLVRSGQ